MINNRRSLSARLITLLCSAIIPLNILLIVFSLNYIKEMEYNIQVTHKAELERVCSHFDYSMDSLVQSLLHLQQNRRGDILDFEQGRVDGINQRKFWQELKNIRETVRYASVGFMRIETEAFVRTTMESAEYTEQEQKSIKNALYMASFPEARLFAVSSLELGGIQFLLWSIASEGFAYGFLVPTDTFIRTQGISAYEDAVFSLLDAEGKPLSKTATEAPPNNWLELRHPVLLGAYQVQVHVPEQATSSSFRYVRITVILLITVTLLAVPLLWLLIRREVVNPLKLLQNAMRSVGSSELLPKLDVCAPSSDFVFVYETFNNMTEEISRLRIESYDKEIQRLQIEAINLRLQVNPHLLLNSLNLVHSLSLSKNYEKISSFSRYLAEFFRYALKQDTDLVALGKELDIIEKYLGAQEIRFPDSFEYQRDVSEQALDFLIPPLLVQNFIENSIKYALIAGQTLHLKLVAKIQDGKFILTISDDGAGISKETMEAIQSEEPVVDKMGTHIGIWNCRRRLRLFYEGSAIHVQSASHKGTTVTITVPLMRGDDGIEAFNGR